MLHRRCGEGLAKTTVRESMVGSTIISMWLKRSLDLRPEMGKIFERCENYYKATALKCTLFDTSFVISAHRPMKKTNNNKQY